MGAGSDRAAGRINSRKNSVRIAIPYTEALSLFNTEHFFSILVFDSWPIDGFYNEIHHLDYG